MRHKINLDYEISRLDPYTRHRALFIQNPSVEMSGEYTCKVSTLENEASQSSTMIVYTPPRWVDQQQNSIFVTFDSFLSALLNSSQHKIVIWFSVGWVYKPWAQATTPWMSRVLWTTLFPNPKLFSIMDKTETESGSKEQGKLLTGREILTWKNILQFFIHDLQVSRWSMASFYLCSTGGCDITSWESFWMRDVSSKNKI